MSGNTKTSATAVVTLTVNVHLDQPWSAGATLEQVQSQARADAVDVIARAATELSARRIFVGSITKIRIILNEETL